MYKIFYILCLLISGLMTTAVAQQGNPPPDRQGMERLAQNLFPPELVIRAASRIDLTDDQKQAIKEVIKQTEVGSLDLKWDLGDEAETLLVLMEGDAVDEDRVMQQADKVMLMEKEMKLMQLSMLLQIRNILRPEQIQELHRIRNNNQMPQNYRELPPGQ